MTDLLVRDVPRDVVVRLDENAQRLGVSRTEYLRRALVRAATPQLPVTTDDLVRFAESFVDLADPEVMGRAWR